MLIENRAWGAIPKGFKQLTDSSGVYLVVREDRLGEITASICGDNHDVAEHHYYGRRALRAIRLRDGETALIRDYRHGGLFRAVMRAYFFTWPPRPFRELAITEELRRRGLRTVEVYAAGVQRLAGPFYRGCLVSRELRDAADLWSTIQDKSISPERLRAILKATADIVNHMHREGVYHSDLNLKNILIRSNCDQVDGYIIDFDKAKLFLGGLPPELVRMNLHRLLRSALKLDPQRRYLSSASWREFLNFYENASPG
jgi:hypothetical protein